MKNVPIEQIIPYEKNPRINEQAIDWVIKSIKRNGFRDPIEVDEEMVILAGHTRLEALKKMGFKVVPEVIQHIDMNEEQKKSYRVENNKAGEWASFDMDLLIDELGIETLEDMGFSLEQFGEEEDIKEKEIEEMETDTKCPKCGYEF